MNKLTIGEKLIAVRNAKRLKQTAFSKLIGIWQPNLSDYENDKVVPSAHMIKEILQKAGVNLAWWETGQGEILIDSVTDDQPEGSRSRTRNGLEAAAPTAVRTVIEELVKLADLKEKGVITDDEFYQLKQRLLNGR